jgi:hypothetical protein
LRKETEAEYRGGEEIYVRPLRAALRLNVSVHLVPGFISCPANTISAISDLKLYNATK